MIKNIFLYIDHNNHPGRKRVDGFKRNMISAATCAITIAALICDHLGANFPTWSWLTWITIIILWSIYDWRTTSIENKRINETIDSFLRSLKPAPNPSAMEENDIDGQTLITHPARACQGQFCVIHNPSDHRMRDWPRRWRPDRAMTERICDHGIGHPDPDDVDWHQRNGRGDISIHGCDGCCARESV